MPSRVTRYIWSELTTPTLLGLMLYTFVLLMNRFFLVAEQTLARDLGWDLTIRLILLYVPNLMVLAIPMSVLLGCLIGIGRFSADHEWVALQSAGQGPKKLLGPLMLFGLACSLVCFLIYTEVVPRANYALRNLRGEMLFNSNVAADIKPRVFYTDLDNVVLYVNEIEAGSQGRLESVLLVKSTPGSYTELYLARYGYLSRTEDGTGALLLELHDGVNHLYAPDNVETYRSSSFVSVHQRFDPAAYLQALSEPPDKVVQDFDSRELWEEFRQARTDFLALETEPDSSSGINPFIVRSRYTRTTIEIHQRLALPLACFFFACLSLPLGVTRVRSGKGAGFAMSLLVILIYWASFTFARDQAIQGKIPAVLGPWVGNLLMMPWAAWGLFRMRRPASERGGPISWLLRIIMRLFRGLSSFAPRRPAASDSDAEPQDSLSQLEALSGTPARFVARLDQYIGVQFIRILVLSLTSAYLIFALVESKTLMDGLLRTEQPFSLMLTYFKFFAPGLLPIVLPISALIGAVVAMTLLTRTGELTAIKAMGISMRRATVPVIVLTAVLCALLFVVQDRIAPPANRRAQAVKDQIMGRAPRSYGTPVTGQWGFVDGQRLYHYQVYDSNVEEFLGLRVFTIDREGPRVMAHRYSERARWLDDEWELQNGHYRTFPAAGGLTYEVYPETINLPLDRPDEFSKELSLTSVADLPDQMSMSELRQKIEILDDSGFDITKLRVAYHGKMAQAMTPLIMVLLGLPFAFKVGRKGSLYGIGVAFILVLAYWGVFAIFNALGLETILDARIAAWAPNILFGLLGGYLMLYIRT